MEAKIAELGGNSKVLIAMPSITQIKLDEKSDFIFIGCKKKNIYIFIYR